MKRILSVCSLVLCLSFCFCLCFSLVGCGRKYDDIAEDFYTDTRNGEYNVIQLDFGDHNSGIYFIEEGYGIWSNNGEKHLFDFWYVPETQGGGDFRINIATQQSYYKSVVYQYDGIASCYHGEFVFSGSCVFSDDETVATVSPDKLYTNEMSIDSNYTVVMTKTHISKEDVVPFETALEEMHYVPDEYFDFIANREQAKYSCDAANFWVDGATMTGEWNTNGTIVPIRMQLNDKVPYFEIFDISGETEKSILKAYADVSDATTLKLTDIEGCIFYTKPTVSVFLTKTTK